MKSIHPICFTALLTIGIAVAGELQAQQFSPAPSAPKAPSAPQPGIEPDAVAILRAMSERLAAAKTIGFTAVTTYESPAVNGQPLYYTTISQVSVQRPDKLRVITPGDGPPTEFYYNGKSMIAYDPAMKLLPWPMHHRRSMRW
jgi:hypothetical protein